jgi:hypothetical protein
MASRDQYFGEEDRQIIYTLMSSLREKQLPQEAIIRPVLLVWETGIVTNR